MPDQTIEPNLDAQGNPITTDWYVDLAGEDEARIEQLSQFDSADDFFTDYSNAKNYDWRGAIAGDDDKFKSTLDRYSDPAAFGNAHREAVQKIRTGAMVPTLADDATDDEVKEFRRTNNIPLEVEGYFNDLPEGLVIGERDKDLLTGYAEAMHEINAPTSHIHKTIEWYNGLEEQMQEAEAQLDADQSREVVDQLRDPEEGWGADYRTNMNLVKGLLSGYFGEEATEQLTNGRYQDGRGFFNDINVMKGMAQLARFVNDKAPIIADDPDKLQSMHDEIKEIESKMGTQEYKQDEKMQARYRELVDIRSKHEEAA